MPSSTQPRAEHLFYVDMYVPDPSSVDILSVFLLPSFKVPRRLKWTELYDRQCSTTSTQVSTWLCRQAGLGISTSQPISVEGGFL